ncbi:MAG: hypothetical protein HUK28_00830 [Methanobrevibacter sp.]|nr:hypothetical protein [Methanobrevibacter sp.]
MEATATSKIYKNYQTAIPKEIRKHIKDLDLNKTILDWSIDDKGIITIKPRRKRTAKDLKGMIKLDHKTDSVQLKKELYLYD